MVLLAASYSQVWSRSHYSGRTGPAKRGAFIGDEPEVIPLLIAAAGATALSCFFALLSYTLRAFRRVALEETFASDKARARLDWLDDHLNPLRLMMSLLCAVANLGLVLVLLEMFELADLSGPVGTILWAGLTGLLLIAVFGVGIPHAWAHSVGELILRRSTWLIRSLYFALWPIVRLMSLFDLPVRRLSGVGDTAEENGDTAKQEILSAATEGRAEGEVDADELEMIESVIEFADTHAGEIMTPRTDIFALAADISFEEAAMQIIEAGHTRVPLFQDDIDNIVGVLYAKDLLRHAVASEATPLSTIMRKPYFVPESKALDDLLAEFKSLKLHMAVVLDEYGGTAGLVTIEDVVEEIVGEITDEYDDAEPELIQMIDATTVEAEGRAYIDDINDALKLEISEDEDYDTVAGLVFSELGHVPTIGETVDAYGARFTVLDADERKINRLRVEKRPNDTDPEA